MDSFSAGIALVAAALAIVIPVFLVRWYARKHSLPVKVALLGAGFFIIVQILHVPFVLLTQAPLFDWLARSFGSSAAIVGVSVFLGVLAALFEEIGRYLVFTRLFKEKSLEHAKLFGLGWGGVESLIFMGLLGTVSIFASEAAFAHTDVSTLNATLISQGVSPQQAEVQIQAFERQKAAFAVRNPFEPLLGVFERFIAIAFHVCASLLVMMSVMKGNKRGLFVAIGGHFFLDFLTAYLVYSGFSTNPLLLEGILTVCVAAFVWFTARELGVGVKQLAA